MNAARRDLPAGEVTLLFTDIEGSTSLLHALGAPDYASALAEHRRRLREAFAAKGGVEVDTQGDAFFIAFPDAPSAARAAADAQRALADGPVRVRMGLHTGWPHVTDEGYVGDDVHLGARIAAAAHGGQVVLSRETEKRIEVETTDLGEHRLKDFGEAVWIFQLGSEQFPPLKTISNTNLPRPASSFVGRDREVEELRGLVRDGARLVTLTGPGGSGKTRLAIEVAADLVPGFRGGVFWVGLAPIREAALAVETIAHTLGAKDGLAEHIGARELMLVLDNFEQVIDAAAELSLLLESCPNLHVLVTSRERLRVRSEVEYPVQPLATPEAVALFSARAGLAADETVAELCARLDNLPLAVELAAARASLLTPAQIIERLGRRLDLFSGGRDTDARQHTLRATIAWSDDLLDEEERRVFARLAVFAGGCSVEDAERVTGADLDTLQSLLDKSLVRRTEGRFWMLETIRDYALERLDESGAGEETRRLHAERYLEVAEALCEGSRTYSREALDRLEEEHDNLRAALAWFQESTATQEALRVAGALAPFWGIRGHFAEGRRRLGEVLAGDDTRTLARATALDAAVDLAPAEAAPAAKGWAEEALSIHRELGDTRGTASSLLMLGSLYEGVDWARAREHWEESACLFAEAGDRHHALFARRLLAWSLSELGEGDAARSLHEQNLGDARALGDEHMEAQSLEALAHMAISEGRLSGVGELLLRAYRIHARLGDPFRIGIAIGRFAAATAAGGDARTAAALLACSERLLEEIAARQAWVLTLHDETRAAILRALDEESYAGAAGRGRDLTSDEAVELALAALGAAPTQGGDGSNTG